MDGEEGGKVDEHNSGGVACLWRIQRHEDETAKRVWSYRNCGKIMGGKIGDDTVEWKLRMVVL